MDKNNDMFNSQKKSKEIKKSHISIKNVKSIDKYIEYIYCAKTNHFSISKIIEKKIIKNFNPQEYDIENLCILSKEDTDLSRTCSFLSLIRNISNTRIKSFCLKFTAKVLTESNFLSENNINLSFKDMMDNVINIDKILYDISKISDSNIKKSNSQNNDNKKNLIETKNNFMSCLIIWNALRNSLKNEEIVQCFYKNIWKKRNITDSENRNFLNQISKTKNIPFLCKVSEAFSHQIYKLNKYIEDSEKNHRKVFDKNNQLELDIAKLKKEISAKEECISRLKIEKNNMKKDFLNTITGMKDDYEILRSRQVRKLKENISLLSDGLHAIRRERPKIYVMTDHAERVLDALNEEVNYLEKGGKS